MPAFRLDVPLSLMLTIKADSEDEAIAKARKILGDSILEDGADTDYTGDPSHEERLYYCDVKPEEIEVANVTEDT